MSEHLTQTRIALAEHIIKGIFDDGLADGAARQLEDEIERRGLEYSYVRSLVNLVAVDTAPGSDGERWALIRATPEQRAKAFLQAIGEKNA